MKLKEDEETNDVPHPVTITGYQVDNLANISSRFRIVGFRSLVLFLLRLLLVIGFIYQIVDGKRKEAVSGKNLLLESLLEPSSLSLFATPEKSFRLRALS